MVKKNSLFYLVIVSLTMKMVLIDVVMSLFTEGSPFILHAQVDFFSSSPKPGSLGELGYGSVKNRVGEKARVIFFISPGCRSCPDEAAILEGKLKGLGVSYEIHGVFLGDPSQVGAYLAELQTYPFNFELEVDMDGSIVRRYGVKTFPSAVIEKGGKRIIVTRADELEEKLNKAR